MWVAVIAGVFGLVTVTVKTILDLGSRSKRRRQYIRDNVDLLEVLPEGLGGRSELKAHIEWSLLAYVEDVSPVPRREEARQPDTDRIPDRLVIQEAHARSAELRGREHARWLAAAVAGLSVTGLGGALLALSTGPSEVKDAAGGVDPSALIFIALGLAWAAYLIPKVWERKWR